MFQGSCSSTAASRGQGVTQNCRISLLPDSAVWIRRCCGVRAVKRAETATLVATAAKASIDDCPGGIPYQPSEEKTENKGNGKVVGSVIAVGGLGVLILGGILFKDQIRDFLLHFTGIVDQMGPLGYLVYAAVYTGLEVLAVPAIPLTMASGAIFGIVPGSIIVSFSGTVAASISFLIARYAARERFLAWAEKSKQFRAMNRVIEQDGFKVVTLLRLSPLLPLAASNYLYGLTNVSLPAFFFGSWLGMLPGTIAYVSAGHVGKAAFLGGESLPLEWWQVALAVGVSVAVVGYIGSLAKAALSEMDEEERQTSITEHNSQRLD